MQSSNLKKTDSNATFIYKSSSNDDDEDDEDKDDGNDREIFYDCNPCNTK